MVTYKMEVNRKENGKYEKIGTVDVPIFALEDFGLPVQATGKDDEGLPTYGNPAVDWVFQAVVAAIKADARNKLVSGTVNLKPGNAIAQTVQELIAPAERSGEALAIAREFYKSFAEHLATHSGKSAAVQAVLLAMAKNKATIALSSEARRNALVAQLSTFAETLSAEDAARYERIILSLVEAAQQDAVLDDSDF